MKFDAWPVEPPGLGSGPLSIRTRSLQPRRTRWWTRLLPTIPAPMTTARAVRGRAPAAPDCSSTEVTSGSWRMAGNLIYHTRMHSSRELRSSSFAVRVDGRPARLEDLFEGFGEQDRLGVVMSRPCGAVGASALIAATITAFYDLYRARGEDFFVYPDYYLFHVGRPLGDHARLDVWPRRKEVVVGAEPQAILEAIDDRAISRLVVEDGEPADRTGLGVEDGEPADRTGLVVEDGEPADGGLDDEVVASARGRIRTCLAYSPAGRAHDADVEIAGNRVTEGYVEAILDPESRIERLRAELAEAESRIERLRAELAEAETAAPQESAPRSGAASATAPQESAPRSGAASATAPQADALGARIASIQSRLGEVDRDSRMRILRARSELLRDGVPVETYRRISLDEALGLLGPRTPWWRVDPPARELIYQGGARR